MTLTSITIADREAELADYLARQPYLVEQDGITLSIAKNVFPSDFGLTSSFFGDFMLQQRPVKTGLDMGCGSGYFAFILKKIGCEEVIGVDFNPDAVACARHNGSLNPDIAPSAFIHSDLFASVPAKRFGMIVFNFNYYPSNGTFGLNEDGGQQILRRFFREVPDYLEPDAQIFIPFSDFVGAEHDPKHVAPEYGFNVNTVAETYNHAGRHVIYQINQNQFD
ncbi:methyltransferase [Methylomonas sp. HW2-6]|uniref:methyltransferase n=1 Tax=Methylomonas sp. HW2-6 TaxID=3376687 RepID=UPI0040433ADC